MGAFARHFGIRPWEWDQLNLAEAFALMKYADDLEGGGQ